MNTTALSIALFAVEQLLKHAPTAFLKFREIIADKDITVEQLRAKREAIAAQEFEHLVPNSQLPPEQDTPQAPV